MAEKLSGKIKQWILFTPDKDYVSMQASQSG